MNRVLEKTKEDYNIIASHFSEKRKFIWGDIKPFLKFIKPGDKVLDAGCGNGRLFRALKRKKVNYLGIDFSKELLKIAKKENPRGNFKYGDLTKTKTWENLKNFDACCCIAVFHHLPSPKSQLKLLEHIRRALRPNGVLIITVWNLWQRRFWTSHLKQLLWKIFKGFKFKWVRIPYKINDRGKVARIVNRFCYAFSIRELEEIAKKAGFEIIKKKISRNLCLAARKVV